MRYDSTAPVINTVLLVFIAVNCNMPCLGFENSGVSAHLKFSQGLSLPRDMFTKKVRFRNEPVADCGTL